MHIINFKKFRRFIFWTLDAIIYGRVKKHYDNIKKINDSNQTSIKSTTRLERIIDHALSKIPFYKSLNISNYNDFPVINKNIINSSFDLFLAEDYRPKSSHIVRTSGSTGTPFKLYQDKNKKARNTADTIYFSELAGYKIGDRLFYIRLVKGQNCIDKLSFWFKNISNHNVLELSDSDISNFLNRLSKYKYDFGILAYSSAYDVICKYLKNKNSQPIKSKVNSIIANAESLSNSTKKLITHYFGCPIISRYSTSETGILAQQSLHKDYFIINNASYKIEIFKISSDEPEELGKMGRIIITDLFNYAMPLIKYDTGDLGIMNDVNDRKDIVLTHVQGRMMDTIFNTSGEVINSHIINKICECSDVLQYQFVQVDARKYIVRLNVLNSFDREDEIVKNCKHYFGSDTIITIEYMDEIPLLTSGKRREVVNLIKN